MASTPAFTTDNLAALEQAMALGAMRVRYQDREVYYRTLNEMVRLRNIMRRELGLGRNPRAKSGCFSKGL